MIERFPLSAWVAAWTREAVTQWGDDWPRISAYIERRMIALEPNEWRELAAEAASTLSNADERVKH